MLIFEQNFRCSPTLGHDAFLQISARSEGRSGEILYIAITLGIQSVRMTL